MGKFSFEEVNELYVDVLREIGNIGSGNATTAIASMLDLRLNMNVPKSRTAFLPGIRFCNFSRG